MKVTRQTPTLLVLDWAPWFTALFSIVFVLVGGWTFFQSLGTNDSEALFVGAFFVLIGGILFYAAAQRRRLTLDKNKGVLVLRVRTLLGVSVTERPLDKLRSARCERSYGKKPSYKLILEFSGETLPVNSISTSWGQYPYATDIINTWLANHRPC